MDTPFFTRFLLCNLILGLYITGILLLKYILKKHISVKFQYYIWFILLIMFLIPFLPLNNFHLWDYSWLTNFSHSENMITNLGVGNNITNSIIQNRNWMQDFTLSVSRSAPQFLNSGLLAIWIMGIAAIKILSVYGNCKLNSIKKSAQPLQDNAITVLFEQCKKNIGVHRNILLSVSSSVETPMIFGILRPYIILPESIITDFSQNELYYILLHELHHYKNKDILTNYAMNLFQVVYWFNPFVWWAFREMRIEREIACDISVLKMLDEDNYTEYGNTIINFADKIMHSSSITAVLDMGGSKNQIKKRIIQIASYHKESKWIKIKSIVIFSLILLAAFISTPILSAGAAKDLEYHFNYDHTKFEDLSAYFDGYEGSFVLYDLHSNQYTIFNKDKSIMRSSPDSTYKIYSALFALETGIITRDHSTINWDRVSYPYDAWNRDQDLSSAMKNSVTWYFLNLDQQIGRKNLQKYFTEINYGNCDLSGGISNYWLQSSLKISPIEQVQLLLAFYNNDFAFKEENIQTVKDTLFQSVSNGSQLSGKTGTGVINGKSINGWFIGYIESNENTYFFATNIQGEDNTNGSTAANITLSILYDKHIYISN